MSWDTERKKSGKHPWDWIEFEIDRCIHTYGVAPCTAVLGSTGKHKCVNSWHTCQDPVNFSASPFFIRAGKPVSQPPSLFTFADTGLGFFLPFLKEVDHSPAMPDPGESMGMRVKFTATLEDKPHHDIGIDKYVTERNFGDSISKGYESDVWKIDTVPLNYFPNEDIGGESRWALRPGPFGKDEVVNVCRSLDTPSGDPGADGGWGMLNSSIPVNVAQGHVFAVYAKRLTTNNGQFYWGLHSNSASDVLDLVAAGGGSNTNPYFVNGLANTLFPTINKWYLIIGYMHATGYAGADAGISGVYDPTTGLKVSDGVEFRWPADATHVGHRCYHYYNTNISVGDEQHNARPRVFESTVANSAQMIQRLCVDGYEPIKSGTFIRKLKARFPHYIGRKLRWYQGYLTEKNGKAVLFTHGSPGEATGVPVNQTSGEANCVAFKFNWNGVVDNDGASIFFGSGQVGVNRWWIGVTDASVGSKFGFGTWNGDVWGIPHAGLENEDQHVVVQFENNGTTLRKLWLNGVLQAPTQTGTPSNSTMGTDFKLGTDYTDVYRATVTIDNLRIIPRAIDDAEALALYAESSLKDQVGAWDFEEGTGDIVEDKVGSSDITLINSPAWVDGLGNPCTLAHFKKREYVIEKFDGPDASGKISIIAKDVIKLLDNTRAQCPKKSKGELHLDMAEGDNPATFDIVTSDLTEYDLEPGETIDWVRMQQEVLSYTGTSVVSGRVRLSGVTRNNPPAGYVTTREEHEAGELVQRCRLLEGTVPEVLEELMVDFGDMDPSFIPTSDWTAESETWDPDPIKRLVTEPEGVQDLINEVISQTLTWGVWFDEVDQEIKYRAIRPLDPINDVVVDLNDDSHLVAGSIKITDTPDKILNEIQVLFGQIDPTEDKDQAKNYHAGYITIDADSQSQNELRQRRVKRVFSRWHPTSNAAMVARWAERTLKARSKNLMGIEFKLERKDENIPSAQFADLTTIYILNEFGLPRSVRVQILRADASGEQVTYKAREDFFKANAFGRWAPESLDGLLWADATQAQKDIYLFWADEATGKFTNGDDGKAWL